MNSIKCDKIGKWFIIFIYLQLLFLNCFCLNFFGHERFYKEDENENNLDNLISSLGYGTKPYFVEKMNNQTVVVGREATFQCVINNLNKYQVAWFHKDNRAVLAVDDKVINNKNNRVRVANHARTSFYLHIKEVKLDDQGEYMCQINAQPMIYQSAMLHVVVPPQFLESRTSSDVEVQEGESVYLHCEAYSAPAPEIRWRREDNQQIRSGNDTKKVNVVYGSNLNISKATKSDMGAYICIANNSIPAAISKRIFLGVTFPPLIYVPKTKISAFVGQEVILTCLVESYPEAMYYWNKSNQMLITSNMSSKYEISYIKNSTVPYKGELRLRISNLKPTDFTSYVCAVNNHLGKTMGTILLNMLESPSTTPKPTTTSTYRTPQIIEIKPRRPINLNKPIIPPKPVESSDSNSDEEYDPFKPTRRKPIRPIKVPKTKNYDPNQNNESNELYPWPINQSSSTISISLSIFLFYFINFFVLFSFNELY